VPEFTRPATWDDVRNVARLLNEARADYALVGGYAIAAHGFNRFTEDIDILVNPSLENSRRWILALRALPDQATRELLSQPDVFRDDARYALRINDEFTIDVMPSIAGHDWQEMSAHIETVDLDGTPLRVLNIQGLLLTKQGARPKDQADAAVLSEALTQIRNLQL
jgi:Nucleotidyl transferase AbiEii toxin, Type IV TA system